jgi:hypothetical protein
MSVQRRGLDFGRVGALTDIALAIVFGLLLFLVTQWRGDPLPRPVVVAVLFAIPGLLGLVGVVTRQPWLLIAGALPLFPGIFISFSGVGLVFLLPAFLMLVGAAQLLGQPGARRVTPLTFVGAFVIAFLIVFAGWAVLIGMTTSGCTNLENGQICGDGLISTKGLLVAGGCLVAVAAIAILGSRMPSRPDHGSDGDREDLTLRT